MAERYKYLEGFEFSGCGVFSWNIIAFWGQKWGTEPDTLETRPTAVFFYYADDPPDKRWAVSGIGQATGVHGCAAFVPRKAWVLVLDDGEVYVVGGGFDDFEQKIPATSNAYFTNVKSIRSGPAMAVGPRRKVFIRQGPDQWVPHDTGLVQGTAVDASKAGFSDIDGFDASDLYACGGHGDVWHYDGRLWAPVDVPTNAVLYGICCATDGYVYITTNTREVLRGRGRSWEVVTQNLTTEVLESIVDFGGRVLVATVSQIFEVDANGFKVAALGAMPPMKSRAHLATGDGILLVAGVDEAATYDGTSWSIVLSPAP